jgi:hypothetical protein
MFDQGGIEGILQLVLLADILDDTDHPAYLAVFIPQRRGGDLGKDLGPRGCDMAVTGAGGQACGKDLPVDTRLLGDTFTGAGKGETMQEIMAFSTYDLRVGVGVQILKRLIGKDYLMVLIDNQDTISEMV